jgi:putative tricarboxylic transport membrane protein
MIAKLKESAPYWVTLAVSVYFFGIAQGITAPGTGDQLGPDFWPKAFLILMMLVCAIGIARVLLVRRHALDEAFADDVPQGTAAARDVRDAEGEPAQRYPLLLLAGIILCVAYVALFAALGFFVDTFLFLLAFILVGRYRRPGIALAVSGAGTLVFMFVFMKIVYVSLPIGAPPFSEVSILLMRLMGIR